MADHNSTVSVNVTLDGPPAGVVAFGTELLLFESATIHDGTDRVRSYSSADDAEDDADLPAGALAAARTAFAQPTPPSLLKIGRKVPATETWPEALAAVRAVDDQFYGLSISSRAAADVEAVSEVVEPLPNKVALLQTSEASILTDTLAAAIADAFERERTAIVFHNDDTQWADVGWAANRLVADPDIISAPWDCELAGVSAPTTLTTTQYNYAIGHGANILAPLDGAAVYLDPGVNGKGRPIYEILTRDWFSTRLQERVTALRVELSRRYQKLVLDDAAGATSAQQYLLSIIGGLYQEGLAAGHFIDDTNARFYALAISADDLSARRVRVKGQARFAVSGRLFDFNINLTRNALR